jgi:hypothetical protein
MYFVVLANPITKYSKCVLHVAVFALVVSVNVRFLMGSGWIRIRIILNCCIRIHVTSHSHYDNGPFKIQPKRRGER